MSKSNLEFATDSSGAISRLPQKSDEIVITDYQFEIMKEYGLKEQKEEEVYTVENEVKVNSLKDVIGRKVRLRGYGYDEKLYTIVGVLKTNLDLTEFEELKEINTYKMTSQQYDLASKLSRKIDEGFNNLIIMTEDEIATLCNNNVEDYTDLNFCLSDDYNGNNSSKIGYIDNDDADIFFFDGRTGGKEQLKDNEVLVDPATYLRYGDYENNGYQFYLVSYPDNGTYEFEENTYNKAQLGVAIRNKFNEIFGSYGTSLPVCVLNTDYEKDTSKDYKIVGLYYDEESYNHEGALFFKNKEVIPAEARVSFNLYKCVTVNLIENPIRNRELIMSLSEYDSKTDTMVIRSEISRTLEEFCDIIKMLAKIFVYVGIGFAAFAALLLMNFIAISISYKKKEIGILRALGARGSDVYGIFLNESMIITLINFIISLAFTITAVIVINHIVLTEFNFKITLLNFGIRQILLLLAVSIVVALVATFLPTHKISKMKPIDAILDRKTK